MNGSQTTTPDSQNPEKPFHFRKTLLYQGICCLLLFAGMVIFSFYALLTDPAITDREYYMFIFSIVFWSFWTTGSIWMILSYHYASLTIQGNKIIEQGVLLRKELDLDHIRQLRWIASPSGGIKLKSLTEKLTIYLEYFPYADRLWIVEYLREQIPVSAQEGWDLFCHRVALPLRRYDPQALPVPDNNEVLLTRKRWDRLLIPCILLFTVGGGLAAWKLNLPRLFSAPLLPTAFWLFLRFSTPKKGMVSRKISADKESSSYLTFLGGMLAAYMIILVALNFIDNPPISKSTIMLCLTVVWSAVVLWKSHRIEKAQHKKQLETSKASVEEWEAGNSPSG